MHVCLVRHASLSHAPPPLLSLGCVHPTRFNPGCVQGCTFCATGTMGLTADLTAGEIVEQLVHASRVANIRNIVFMGMGEPLNNYEAVRSAVQMMTDPRYFGLRRKKVRRVLALLGSGGGGAAAPKVAVSQPQAGCAVLRCGRRAQQGYPCWLKASAHRCLLSPLLAAGDCIHGGRHPPPAANGR